MKKVKKLTPATLKRIIAEERSKLKKDRLKKKSAEKNLVEKYIRVLRLLKESQRQKNNDAAKIYKVRKLVKRKLLKRL